MIIIAKNNSGITQVINDLGGFPINDGTYVDLATYFSVHELSHSNNLLQKVANSDLTINNGIMDLEVSNALRYISLFLDNTITLAPSTSSIGTVAITDGANVDAFSRMRTSSTTTLFDSNFIYNDQSVSQDSTTGGSGTTTYISKEASIRLSVGTDSGAFSIRQTRQYFRYQPGKSQIIISSFTFGESQLNLVKRAGYFDTSDGIFIQQDSTGIAIVLRSSTSGSVVDTKVYQESQNICKLDGTDSGIGVSLDPTKSQIVNIDIQYIGAGRVRIGFVINGTVYYVHEFQHANISAISFMMTASLPLRFEIFNIGTISSPSYLTQMHSSVLTEGGDPVTKLFSRYFSVSTGTTTRTISTSSYTPVIAIRLKTLFCGKINRGIVIPTDYDLYSADKPVNFRLIYNPATLTGASQTSVDSNSMMEYDVSTTAFSGGIIMAEGYLERFVSKVASKSFDKQPLALNAQGTSADILLIVAKAFGTAASLCISIGWEEIY